MKNFFKGFLMGISEIVPGVSGSTLALVMNIYYDFISLLYQISNFLKEIILFLFFKTTFKNIQKQFKKINFTFAIPLFLGMLLSIALFSNLMHYLIEYKKMYVLAFFFGLVLGSVSVPWAEIKEKKLREIIIIVFTFVLFFLLLSLKPLSFEQVPSPLYFFLGGSLGICAMVLPGVSGSFVFLLLGLYEFIIEHISRVTKFESTSSEILNLVFLAFGIVFGFSVFVRILKHALKNHSSIIYAILTGIILASLRVLWPFNGEEVFVILGLSALGFVMVSFLKKFS